MFLAPLEMSVSLYLCVAPLELDGTALTPLEMMEWYWYCLVGVVERSFSVVVWHHGFCCPVGGMGLEGVVVVIRG